jgi:hypothetical protein
MPTWFDALYTRIRGQRGLIEQIDQTYTNSPSPIATGVDHRPLAPRTVFEGLRPSPNDWLLLIPLTLSVTLGGLAAYIAPFVAEPVLASGFQGSAENWWLASVLAALVLAILFFHAAAAIYAFQLCGAIIARRTHRRHSTHELSSDPATWIPDAAAQGRLSIWMRLQPHKILILPIRELYGFFHNAVVAPTLDRFIWIRLQRSAQGNDLVGRVLDRVTSCPVIGEEHPPLIDVIDNELLSAANDHASQTVGRLRRRLGVIAASGTDVPNMAQLVKDENLITFKELIHNTYFGHKAVRQQIAAIIRGIATRPAPVRITDSEALGEPDRHVSSDALRAIVFVWGLFCMPTMAVFVGILPVILLFIYIINTMNAFFRGDL